MDEALTYVQDNVSPHPPTVQNTGQLIWNSQTVELGVSTLHLCDSIITFYSLFIASNIQIMPN